MSLSISVVIPTYNRAALVPRAVASAIANVIPGDEIIVVDDGSNDGTRATLAPYRDKITLLEGRHAGAGAARNLGIAAARGDVVAFLDSDDEWRPNKLALQRALLEARPDVLFCFSDFALREASGDVHHYLTEWHHDTRSWDQILAPGNRYSALARLPEGAADFQVHMGDIYLNEMLADYIATFTLAVRRREADSALRFAEDTPTYEDWECFARLAAAGKAAYMDCELVWNHGHAGPRLTDANTYVAASTRIKIMERTWGADEGFLAKHRTEYTQRLYHFYHLRAQWLLCRGRTREAREDLARAGAAPLAERALAAMPGFIVRGLVGLRRLAKGQSAAGSVS